MSEAVSAIFSCCQGNIFLLVVQRNSRHTKMKNVELAGTEFGKPEAGSKIVLGIWEKVILDNRQTFSRKNVSVRCWGVMYSRKEMASNSLWLKHSTVFHIINYIINLLLLLLNILLCASKVQMFHVIFWNTCAALYFLEEIGSDSSNGCNLNSLLP